MKRLRLLSDQVLVYLWRIGNGVDKPVKGRVWWAFRDENLDTLERLDFTLLKLEGVLDVKNTLSKLSIELGYKRAEQLRRKVDAIIGPFYHSPESVKSLLDQADKDEKYFKYLEEEYGETGDISYKDYLRISKYYPEVKKHIYTNVIVQNSMIKNLQRYLGRYIKNYDDRNLEGQERIALADVYANIISRKINSENFVRTYGLKRISLDSDGIPFFAHSMIYLDSKKIIDLHDMHVVGDKITATLSNVVPGKASEKQTTPAPNDKKYKYDAFISHAYEDKEEMARPLAKELTKLGVKVWYDEFTLTVGDSLMQKINQGLAESKYGIVVLSEDFFNKGWTRLELNGLASKAVSQENGQKVILPVWHKITKEKIMEHYPVLADIVAEKSSNSTIQKIAGNLKRVIAS